MRTQDVQRRFTLLDVGVLIAAVAIGFALTKPALAYLEARPFQLSKGMAERAIFYGSLYGTPVLITSSLALVGLSVRRPRPPMRRLLRSPGFVANAGGLLGVLVSLTHHIGEMLVKPSLADGTYMHALSTGLPGEVGYFVMGALLPLVFRGQWRPYPTWTDRLGWLVGMLWIVMSLLGWARLYLILW